MTPRDFPWGAVVVASVLAVVASVVLSLIVAGRRDSEARAGRVRAEQALAEAGRLSKRLRDAEARADRAEKLLERQHREDTIAITAVYQLKKPFDTTGEKFEPEFHSFCDRHVDDALWYSVGRYSNDAPKVPLGTKRASLLGYGTGPDKTGGHSLECRWSVVANRRDWCRRYLESRDP